MKADKFIRAYPAQVGNEFSFLLEKLRKGEISPEAVEEAMLTKIKVGIGTVLSLSK